MNTGGVRAPLYFEPSAGEDGPGQVRYGEAFAVQPFSNVVSTVTLAGADVIAALDVRCGDGPPLQVAGITYSCVQLRAPGHACWCCSTASRWRWAARLPRDGELDRH